MVSKLQNNTKSSSNVSQSYNKKEIKNKEDFMSNKEIVISDQKKQKYFKNLPYFDFLYAEEELGFCFSEFAKNGFADFINSMYAEDFINLRKCYITRNYIQVRFLTHKFKSPFGLFCCDLVKNTCENLQSAIDKGEYELEDLYIEVLIGFSKFLNKLKELCVYLELDLHPRFTKKFLDDNEKCNQLEDIRIKAKIIPDFDTDMKGNRNQIIILDKGNRAVCCNDNCTIF